MLNILIKKRERTSKKADRVWGWSCPRPGFSLVLEAPLTGEELEGLPHSGHTSGKFPGGLVSSPRLALAVTDLLGRWPLCFVLTGFWVELPWGWEPFFRDQTVIPEVGPEAQHPSWSCPQLALRVTGWCPQPPGKGPCRQVPTTCTLLLGPPVIPRRGQPHGLLQKEAAFYHQGLWSVQWAAWIQLRPLCFWGRPARASLSHPAAAAGQVPTSKEIATKLGIARDPRHRQEEASGPKEAGCYGRTQPQPIPQSLESLPKAPPGRQPGDSWESKCCSFLTDGSCPGHHEVTRTEGDHPAQGPTCTHPSPTLRGPRDPTRRTFTCTSHSSHVLLELHSTPISLSWGWGDGVESLESRSLCPPLSCDLSSEIQPSHHTLPDQAKPSELCPLCFYVPVPCSAAWVIPPPSHCPRGPSSFTCPQLP